MKNDQEKIQGYCQKASKAGAVDALITSPKYIVTAPWVQWRCRFGCPDYGKWHCCPPMVPNCEETRRVLDSYTRLILLHFQYRFESPKWPASGAEYRRFKRDVEYVVELEREIFLDGFYRAFAMPHEPCQICEQCALIKNKPCSLPEKARPSMESVGIDVYQTASNHNLPIHPIRSEQDTCNWYALILVD
ncbi:MAG: DUF2284 domain-containing protein [Dehalococcoidales bacterium]|nr:DUF2284 domain-containing protein [Dehalococcoidales bacterium]